MEHAHHHKHHEGNHHHMDKEHKEEGHHHSEHRGHMIEDFKKRFYVSLAVTIPILILSLMIQAS
ncbi:hypothetical protein [Bacillus taeanensis]|uniref:Heavy metal translocating P-type ATPase n=1 Tax=Bacillus taeanensis TaxID=273032 RepID=A0A366XUW2_9BACI|nr:hypothetical protein [Bacillus taeanensis]RBW70180.1 hypothetical protein DS031_08305 [Bacillus taeanensis]